MYGVTPVGYANQPYQAQQRPQTQQGSSAVSINIFEPKVINYPSRSPKSVYDCPPGDQYQPKRYQPIPIPVPVVSQPIYYPTPSPQIPIAQAPEVSVQPIYSPIHKRIQSEKPIFEPAPMVEIPEMRPRVLSEIPIKEPEIAVKPEIQEQPVYVPPVMEPQAQTVYVNQPVTQEAKQLIPVLQPVPQEIAPAPVATSPAQPAAPKEAESTQVILAGLSKLNQDLAGDNYDNKLEALNQIAKLSLGPVEGDDATRQNLINTYSTLVKELGKPSLGEKDANKEKADKVKQRSMFTLALLNKAHNGDTPLAELPGVSQIAAVLKNDQDANMRASALSALEHVSRPQDVPILSKIFNTKALDDPSPKVKAIAKDAYDNLIKLSATAASVAPLPEAAAPPSATSNK